MNRLAGGVSCSPFLTVITLHYFNTGLPLSFAKDFSLADMTRTLLCCLLLLFSAASFSQYKFLAFKKGRKTLADYPKDGFFAFMRKDRSWVAGDISDIRNDSFFIRPMIIRHSLMGQDTVHLITQAYSIHDVYALPNKGIKIEYMGDRFRVNTAAGHVHFYWIQSGWLFRTGALGYTGLSIINDLANNDPPFAKKNLEGFAIAGGVFLFGKLLHRHYKYYLPMKGKYQLLAKEI